MASSKVQVPASAPYDHVLRDHNRRIRDRERECSTSSKSQAAAFNRNIKELVRDHLHACSIVLASSSRDDRRNTSRDENFHCDENSPHGGGGEEEPSSSSSAAITRKRSRRILDRWAARQAQEMITTIERQTHEAELMALSSNSCSVSERASTFLRETSPAPSDSSSVDLPNLRASSLVQMWKEFEAEARSPGANQTSPNATSPAARAPPNLSNIVDNSSGEEPSPIAEPEICDSNNDERYDSFADWESDQTMNSEHEHRSTTSQEPVLDASDRVRVADIIRRLTTTGSQTHSSITAWSDENDHHHPSLDHGSSLDPSLISDHGEHRDLPFLVHTPRLRGRQAFLDLLMQLERERHHELNRLGERHAVSRFPQRGRIQSLLKLRFLQGEVKVYERQHPLRSLSSASLNQLRERRPILRLRERFNPRAEQSGSPVRSRENDSLSCLEIPNSNQDSELPNVSNQPTDQTVHHQETATAENDTSTMSHIVPSTSDENAPTRQVSIASTSEPQQEDKPKGLDVSSSHVGNPNSKGPMDVERLSHGWEGNAITEESDPDSRQQVRSYDSWDVVTEEPDPNTPRWDRVTEEPDLNTPHVPETSDELWLNDVSLSQRDWEASRQEWFEDSVENNTEEEAIQELLQRRPVSNLLSSGFRQRMERLLLAHLERNERIAENADEDLFIEHQYHVTSYDSDQGPSSTSLQLPLPSRMRSFNDRYHHVEVDDDSDLNLTEEQSPSEYHGSQPSPFASRHPSLEMELICDLRGHMERIHHEMSELRKSVENCVGMQMKMQKSIKEEVAAAVSRSIRGGEAIESSSPKTPAKKGNCCICYEMPVDSLLYRCGHMCTCYKCAHELQWSSSRCPICRAPILDVVRAYSNA